MTKGYLQGRLNFKYNNPLSKLRESYIINQIEKEELGRIKMVRTLFDSIMATSIKSQQSIEKSFESYKDMVEFALPYIYKNHTMDSILEDKAKMAEIRERLRSHKKNKTVKRTK